MPPFTGRHGIRDFTEPTTATNPKQPCDLPYEGDVFAGNDNNRRAVHAKMKFEAQAAGEEFDSEAAWQSLGGKVEPKTAPEPTDDQNVDTDTQAGSQDAPKGDTQGEEAKGEQKTTVKPPKPPAGAAPAWKPNA